MIPVKRVPEPGGFDKDVRRPGARWLKENPEAKRPYPYWTEYTPNLAAGFQNRCGYAAMLDPTGGTVDHYLSFKNRRDLAYEWSNYRYAASTLNSSKKNADEAVLDPYEVKAGWFEILLPSLQMRMTDAVPERMRAKAQRTLDRLQLHHGERIIRWRKSWYDLYVCGMLSLDGLRRVAPLIAAAVEKQQAGRPRLLRAT